MTDIAEPPVLLTRDTDRVRVITFNRPDAANAFNEKLYHEVANALRAAADDDGVSVVVLTGAGRTFCGGTDLHEMANAVPETPTPRQPADDRPRQAPTRVGASGRSSTPSPRSRSR